MKKDKIKVLHIDSERGWRGGQQQAAYLLEQMHAKEFQAAMVCKPGSEFEKYCLENKLPHFPVQMHGEIDFTAGIKIAGLCRKYGYTVLHLHSAHALATGLWVKLFYSKVKLVAVRRVDFHIKKNFLSQFKYKTSLLDRIVCISNGIKKVMLKDGVEEQKLATIHSGVDLQKFEKVEPPDDFKQNLGIPENHVVVGTVAAISGHKDYPNLLQAAKIVIERNDNVTFCAVGDGPDEKDVLALHEKLGLGERFIFTGFRKDVGNFLKTFDIFVLASYLEGLGTSILDAQGVGLPVVGCDTGGIPEAVLDGENGLLVPPRDSKALSSAILDLVNDPERRMVFGEKARETVKGFSIDTTVRNNIALYHELVDPKTA